MGQHRTKDPRASELLYAKALAAIILPKGTLQALQDGGDIGSGLLSPAVDHEDGLEQFVKLGVDIDSLAARLQEEGTQSFVNSWRELLAAITAKGMAQAG